MGCIINKSNLTTIYSIIFYNNELKCTCEESSKDYQTGHQDQAAVPNDQEYYQHGFILQQHQQVICRDPPSRLAFIEVEENKNVHEGTDQPEQPPFIAFAIVRASN